MTPHDTKPPQPPVDGDPLTALASLAESCVALEDAARERLYELVHDLAPAALRASGLNAVLLGLSPGTDGAGEERDPHLVLLGWRSCDGVVSGGLHLPDGAGPLAALISAFKRAALALVDATADPTLVLLTSEGHAELPWEPHAQYGDYAAILRGDYPVCLSLCATLNGVFGPTDLEIEGVEMRAVCFSVTETESVVYWVARQPPAKHAAVRATVIAADILTFATEVDRHAGVTAPSTGGGPTDTRPRRSRQSGRSS